MSIIFITIEGEAKKEFANLLQKKTNGAIKLIVIQKKPKPPLLKRLKNIFIENNPLRMFWFSILLYTNRTLCNALNYFRIRSKKDNVVEWPAPIIIVESVNSDEVYKRLSEIAPSLMVVWGSGILKPKIIQTAKQAINLHMGFAPYYRGAAGNQFAIYDNDKKHIGATIHHINNEADAGDIIEIIQADISKGIKDMFCDLNDRAEHSLLNISLKLHSGEELPKKHQDKAIGKNILLKQWTPEIRYKVAKKLINWEERGNLTN